MKRTNLPTISPLHLCRRDARLRQSACVLYQSPSLEEVFLKLEVEVESRRLSIRLDQTIYSDVGLQQQLIELLNSYNVPWLRLGMEVCPLCVRVCVCVSPCLHAQHTVTFAGIIW